MRALSRRVLAPLVMVAAVFSASSPALFAAGPVHVSGPLADCPVGTNWDHILQRCV